MGSLRSGFDALRVRAVVRTPGDVLFLASYYRLAYPDVAEVRRVRRHFERHGKLEGRSPHPLIDVSRLAQQMPDVRLAEVYDTYLSDRDRWGLSPSPYLDVERFMRSGPWDGRSHPVVQILRDRPAEPWVRSRLGAIDLANADEPLRIAAGLVALRHPGLVRLSELRYWPTSADAGSPSELGPGRYRLAAGFVVTDDRCELVGGQDVVSADGTLVRTPGGVLGVVVRDMARTDTLHVLRRDADIAPDVFARGDLIAASTASQVVEIEAAGHRALPLGRQLVVETRRVIVR